MNQCIFCNVESDDVSVVVINDNRNSKIYHQWYCKKCKRNWEECKEQDPAVSFNFGNNVRSNQ